MNLVREKVIHKKYGTGEITKLDNDHVYVKFQSVDQEKKFKFIRSSEFIELFLI